MMVEKSIPERVASVEAHQEHIRKDVHEMRTNHLPHIEQKIDSLRQETAQSIGSLNRWLMGALVSAILALVGIGANLLIQLLLH